eukprot:1131850-Lingulodinium_polyedra.AAC.1
MLVPRKSRICGGSPARVQRPSARVRTTGNLLSTASTPGWTARARARAVTQQRAVMRSPAACPATSKKKCRRS